MDSLLDSRPAARDESGGKHRDESARSGTAAGGPDHGGAGAPLGQTATDVSALAWVHEELRRLLEQAHKTLRRVLRETAALAGADVDAIDPGVLRNARAQLHQGVGALELIGMPEAATVLRASETALHRCAAKPSLLTPELLDAVERLSFALVDYLGRLRDGKPVLPLSLFPQYRAVQEAIGAERVHPADLWRFDWEWRRVPVDLAGGALRPRAAGAEARGAMEPLMLALMRQPVPASFQRMSDLCLELAAGAALPAGAVPAATLWALAAAVFEAQAHGRLLADVFSKRVASRLLAQLRVLERGEHEISERLAQDLLFFCSQAAPPPAGTPPPSPRLAAVRRAYALPAGTPVDYSAPLLGRFDPAWIAQARKRVAAAKESWSAVAGGEQHRLAGLAEQFALVGDSLQRLFPGGEWLAGELQHAVAGTHVAAPQAAGAGTAPETARVAHNDTAPPSPALAMEVATALLYVDACLEEADFDDAALARRVQRLAQRIAAVRGAGAVSTDGEPAAAHPEGAEAAVGEPLEPWMEGLYRRVSERQTMGTVVRELRASLAATEALIDQFFRQPHGDAAARAGLLDVPAQLGTMRGVMSVLGLDHAVAALLRMRDDVDGLIDASAATATAVPPATTAQRPVVDRLAGNLGALGFLIDMLGVQPQLAKSLFVFDAAAGTLGPLMGRSTPPAALPPADPLPAAPALPAGQAQLAPPPPSVSPTTAAQRSPPAGDAMPIESVAPASVASASETPASETPAFDTPAFGTDAPGGPPPAAAGELPSGAAAAVGFETPEAPALASADSAAAPLAAARALSSGPVEAAGEDDEMRGVFLDEAREVLENADADWRSLPTADDPLEALTALRRAFHTLKGSARMVGLDEFGEAAWICEQLYNERLARQTGADEALLGFTGQVLADLAAWVDDIAAGRSPLHDADAVRQAVGAAMGPVPAASPAAGQPPPAAPVDGRVFAQPEDGPEPAPPAGDAVQRRAAVAADATAWPPALPAFDAAALSFDLAPAGAADADEAFGPTSLEPASLEPAAVRPRPSAAAPAAAEALPLLTLDFAAPFDVPAPAGIGAQPGIEAEPEPEPDLEPIPVGSAVEAPDDNGLFRDEEHIKVVGPLRIGIALFNIYLNEADELSRRLATELAEWSLEWQQPVQDSSIALAHSLAGSSATVGYADLSQLARTLEHALARSSAIGSGHADEAVLFVDAADEIRHLLHQFAAGFLKQPSAELLRRLAAHELESGQRLDALSAPVPLPTPTTAAAAFADPDLAEPAFVDTESPEVEPEPAVGNAPASEPEPPPAPAFEPSAGIDVAGWPQFDAEALERVPTPSTPGLPAPYAGAPAPAAAANPATDFGTLRAREGDLGFAELKPLSAVQPMETNWGGLDTPSRPLNPGEPAAADDPIDAVDVIDDELFAFFEEEGRELLPELASRLRDWGDEPNDADHAAAAMRTLHTLKGGARLAGAMRLGELAHRLESGIEHAAARRPEPGTADIEALQSRADTLAQVFDALCRHEPAAVDADVPALPARDTPDAAPEAEWLRVDAAVSGAQPAPEPEWEPEPEPAPPFGLGLELKQEPEPEPEPAAALPPEATPVSAPVPTPDFAATPEHEPDPAADPASAFEPEPATVAFDPGAGIDDVAASPLADVPPTPTPTPTSVSEPPSTPVEAAGPLPLSAAEPPQSAAGTEAPAVVAPPLGGLETEPARSVEAAPVFNAWPDPLPVDGGAGPAAEEDGDSDAADEDIDWSRFDDTGEGSSAAAAAAPNGSARTAAPAAVRVRAPLLDRLVNQSGEISITRARIESELKQFKGSLGDLAENLERLRSQLRDIEMHGETQLSSRLEAAKAAAQTFDPLEFDRFTRFQEVTRMMAESVNDVATVQRALQRSLEGTEDALAAQARLARDLQDDLLRTRMVEFEGASDRLYRVVRQAAKETGKQVRLDIVGGSIEIDRGVLDRIAGAFEHLLRNSVAHGIEPPAVRAAAGKPAVGQITLSVGHEGNEVAVEVRDDGAGLDLARIRARGLALGLIQPDETPSDAELANLIFAAGFSTADRVTELAGRGVGMDVVRSEVNAIGGRIETATEAGAGTAFRLVLPLTTAVTQVVMLRAAALTVAVPSVLVEVVLRLPGADAAAALRRGSFQHGGHTVPYFWLGALLQATPTDTETEGRSRAVVVVRSAAQRVAVQVDEVLGNQEVVVKNLGPQLSRMPGLAGVTLLASGAVALIYNPVALATLYGAAARAATLAALQSRPAAAGAAPALPAAPASQPAPVVKPPLILVVDDSLTVRRVTQRLLEREGYRVALAKDGLDALERLADERPALVLSDIEMPRMDGFDLVRNIRGDARWRDLTVVMITSRIAQKHRDHAAELGVEHYLGKPYDEQDLLALLGRCTARPAIAG